MTSPVNLRGLEFRRKNFYPLTPRTLLANGKGGRSERWSKYGGETGQAILELAAVLPVFILLIIGGADLSRIVGARNDFNALAEMLAQCEMRAGPECANPQTFAQTIASGVGLRTAATWNGTVTVSTNWQPISPFFKATSLAATVTR